ncbi:MAG: hypothetical protein AAF391_09150, partial [Bacteroidota bacterium]
KLASMKTAELHDCVNESYKRISPHLSSLNECQDVQRYLARIADNLYKDKKKSAHHKNTINGQDDLFWFYYREHADEENLLASHIDIKNARRLVADTKRCKKLLEVLIGVLNATQLMYLFLDAANCDEESFDEFFRFYIEPSRRLSRTEKALIIGSKEITGKKIAKLLNKSEGRVSEARKKARYEFQQIIRSETYEEYKLAFIKLIQRGPQKGYPRPPFNS